MGKLFFQKKIKKNYIAEGLIKGIESTLKSDSLGLKLKLALVEKENNLLREELSLRLIEKMDEEQFNKLQTEVKKLQEQNEISKYFEIDLDKFCCGCDKFDAVHISGWVSDKCDCQTLNIISCKHYGTCKRVSDMAETKEDDT